MHLPTYLTLIGAALLVAHLKGVESFALDRTASGDARRESVENVEKALNQTTTEDSDESEDARDSSSEEQDNIVKRSAQFSRNSDEFDNVSFEIDDRRFFQQNAPTQTFQPTRSILVTPQITRVTPTRVPSLPDRLPVPISLRNLPIRQFDDDDSRETIRTGVVATPVQQIAPVRTTGLPDRLPVPIGFRNPILRQTIDFDDDSIEITDRFIAPAQPATISTQTATVNRVVNARRPNIFRQSDERDDVSLEVFSVNQNGQLQQAIRPIQTTNNGAQLIQNVRRVVVTATPQLQSPAAVVTRTPTTAVTNVDLVFTNSAERDDFSDEVIRSSLAFFATPITPTPPTQTATAANRLQIPTGFINQNTRPLNANINRVAATPAPISRIVPAQTVNRVIPIQAVSQNVPVQTVNRNVPIQTVNRVTPTQAISQNVPAQTVNRNVPIQTVNRVIPTQALSQNAQVQTANRIAPVQTVNRATPAQAAAPIAPTQTVNRVIPTQAVNRIVLTQNAPQIVATQTVNRVAPTVGLPNRLPVPIAFRNVVFRQTIDLDDDSIEIRDRNVFLPVNTNNNGQIQTINVASRPVLSQDFDDDSVELELINPVRNQQAAPAQRVAQPAAVNPVQATGNQGQQFVLRLDDDFSREDNRDDDFDDDNTFFLEDQLGNADNFRLLATDFFLQPDTNRAPSVRSVNNRKQAQDYDDDYSLEMNLTPVHLDEADLKEDPVQESDDWFLVKQYMNHDHSSEELEGDLAREYFWEPVKDTNKKTDVADDKTA
ncbi:mucin-2-like [Daphnia carinata]|uniref:mucin-2-like n=1 Tax=Daphnia carinata TaxID=120202 RepID=UPI00257FB1BA|nr:mucin-2-like [Daphnia carinata]